LCESYHATCGNFRRIGEPPRYQNPVSLESTSRPASKSAESPLSISADLAHVQLHDRSLPSQRKHRDNQHPPSNLGRFFHSVKHVRLQKPTPLRRGVPS